MFKRNDGIGDNAVQNKFTALLKRALCNRKLDYIKGLKIIIGRYLPLDDYMYLMGEEYDFLKVIIDFEVIRNALKNLSECERKIIVLHIIQDKDFNEISKEFGLTYKGTATVFYRAISKLRHMLGRY